MGSGCGDGIVEKFLRPPGKLPVPVALNALSLTLFTDYYTRYYRKWQPLFYRYFGNDTHPCSFLSNRFPMRTGTLPGAVRGASRHLTGWVCIGSGPSSAPGFCRIILKHSLLFSAVFPILRTYNGTTYT